MRSNIFIISLLFFASTCFADPDFEGTYRCAGFDPYINKDYSGTVHIVRYNTVYNLLMEYDTGEVARGTAGLWDSATLAVVFQDLKNLQNIGLERYSFSKDRKRIQGYWVYLGKDKLGKEVCEKQKESSTRIVSPSPSLPASPSREGKKQ